MSLTRNQILIPVMMCLGCLCACSGLNAQERGRGDEGGDRSGRMLRMMDRNNDGLVAPDEMFPPIRDYLSKQGVDVSKPVPISVIQEHSEGLQQSFRGRRGGDRERERDDEGEDEGGDNDRPRTEGAPPSAPPVAGPPMNGPPGGAPPTTESNRRSDSATPSAPNSKNAKKAPAWSRAARTKQVTLKLPDAYAARDTNRDGQVAAYEWSRTDLANFYKLDLNGDGFLEPRELVSPGSGSGSAPATAPVASTPSAGPSRSFGPPGRDNRGPGPAVVAPPPPAPVAAPGADPKTLAAMSSFRLLDSNKDGSLSPEELKRSRVIRPAFEKAGLSTEESYPADKFVEAYFKAMAK